MKTLEDIKNIKGKKVLLRVDFNVPIIDNMVTDDYRIRVALPTIEFLRKKGAKIILISHIETSDGLKNSGKDSISGANTSENAEDKKPTLAPVSSYLGSKSIPVTFVDNISSIYQVIEGMKNSDVILLENIRENKGEKENDVVFAKDLASLADIYVNDAFSVSHREHASICAITSFLPSYAGFQLEKEVLELSKAFDPTHPSVFVLGGAKFDTKLPLIQKFLANYDTIFIGGALANDAFKARGLEVGMSKVSSGSTDIGEVIDQPNIIIPNDVVVEDHIEKSVKKVSAKDMILDIGPKSITGLKKQVAEAHFILWNGPMGLCEKGFAKGTEEVARMIAERTNSWNKGIKGEKNKGANNKVVSIVGGGDTLAAISNLGIEKDFTFVSTGGGAMLEFLEKGTLVGIDALNKK